MHNVFSPKVFAPDNHLYAKHDGTVQEVNWRGRSCGEGAGERGPGSCRTTVRHLRDQRW